MQTWRGVLGAGGSLEGRGRIPHVGKSSLSDCKTVYPVEDSNCRGCPGDSDCVTERGISSSKDSLVGGHGASVDCLEKR